MLRLIVLAEGSKGGPCSYLALVFFLCVLHCWLPVHAHEGHRPLPTRGMEVNVEAGKMVLTAAARELLDVQTAEVVSGSLENTVRTYGSVVVPWNQHAVVSSPLAGRIVELKVIPGQTVQAGQMVAAMESLELDRLVLELRAARVEYLLSEKLVANLSQPTESGAVPGSRLRESRFKLEKDRAAVELASAKWKALRLSTKLLQAILDSPKTEHRPVLELRSPIDGVVTHADWSIGKIVDPKEHLCEILDLRSVWLKIQVLEKDLASLAVGQKVKFQLTTNPEICFFGIVDVVDAYLDPVTHLGTVWATLSNEPPSGIQLLPGMTGEVQVNTGHATEHPVVPFSSVMRDGAERFVLVEQEQTGLASIYQKQGLVLGRRSGDLMEVLGGNLYPGDRVVTQGAHELGGYFAKGVLRISDETARDIQLQTETTEYTSVAETVAVDGIVDVPPTHRSVASAQWGGVIERILVDRGQAVHRGQVLAEISSQAFKDLQLELLKTNLDVHWTSEIVHNLRMASEAIAVRQLWEEESKLNQLNSRRDLLIQQLRTSGVTEQQISEFLSSRELIPSLPVRAPIDGIIVAFDKFLGHVVNPEEVLFEVHDLSHVWVKGFVSEKEFPSIRIGQEVRIRFVTAPKEIILGTVTRSGQAISNDGRTLSIWIDLPSMPSFRLQQGMMARIHVATGRKSDGLSVPRQAVVREGLRSYVFVQGNDQTYERRHVVTGPSDDLRTVILQGLQAGESIVSQGARELQSGYAALR